MSDLTKVIPHALVCTALLLSPGLAQPATALGMSVIVGRPTATSATLSVLAPRDCEAFVEHENGPAKGTAKSETAKLKAGVPFEFELDHLAPNTGYSYRLMVRAAGSGGFASEAKGSFHTQRTPGSTFVFGVQGDSHPERAGKMFDPELYRVTMRNVASEKPDFYFAMGDDFSIERLIERNDLSAATVGEVYAKQREFPSIPCSNAALFLVNGNHEQAARCNLDGSPDNCAVLAANARTLYFPLPTPGSFYSGDEERVEHVGLLRDYYAWTWGNALFVVIDPYWHSTAAVDNEAGSRKHGGAGYESSEASRPERKKRDLWQITLGEAQYQWLAKTLTESNARWKFVFCHHVLGTGRGGTECAPLFEWGGRDKRGQNRFAENRPGWPAPIHDLMAKTGVTIFFQGHDHLFAKQELDGVVYQTCPCPADPTCTAFNRNAYLSGDILPGSGHLKVTVGPNRVAVDYIRSVLPKDATTESSNGQVAHHYEISAGEKR